jgi:hypothetical protein
MKNFQTWLFIPWLVLVAGCDHQPRVADPGPVGADGTAAGAVWSADEQRAVGQATQFVQEAFARLSVNLTNALSAGGATNAITFCSVHAAPLTAAASATHPVQLARVSHKARNPTNRASDAELSVLRRFQGGLAQGQVPPPVLTTNAGQRVVYLPIVLHNPLCLNCHGSPGGTIQPETLALLRTVYPKDQATGFRLGELRGMWRVTFRDVSQ